MTANTNSHKYLCVLSSVNILTQNSSNLVRSNNDNNNKKTTQTHKP